MRHATCKTDGEGKMMDLAGGEQARSTDSSPDKFNPSGRELWQWFSSRKRSRLMCPWGTEASILLRLCRCFSGVQSTNVLDSTVCTCVHDPIFHWVASTRDGRPPCLTSCAATDVVNPSSRQLKAEHDHESRNVIAIEGSKFVVHKRTKINHFTEM